jgi:AcrR family transcriptional regulator
MADPTSRGLRADKKARTRAEILANAIALFRAEGIRAARFNQIAEASGVSPATLFNYFPNKGALAEAWVRGEIERALSGVNGQAGHPALRPALRAACRELARQAGDDRAVRLEAWREAGRARPGTLGERHPTVRAFSREQGRERVRADVSAEALAELLIDAVESGLISGLRSELPEGDLARAIQGRVDLVLDGARKRNERVAAPAANSPSRSTTNRTR